MAKCFWIVRLPEAGGEEEEEKRSSLNGGLFCWTCYPNFFVICVDDRRSRLNYLIFLLLSLLLLFFFFGRCTLTVCCPPKKFDSTVVCSSCSCNKTNHTVILNPFSPHFANYLDDDDDDDENPKQKCFVTCAFLFLFLDSPLGKKKKATVTFLRELAIFLRKSFLC